MPPFIHNEEPAAGTNRGGFGFVFSTTHPTRKDQIDVPYHADGARVQPPPH